MTDAAPYDFWAGMWRPWLTASLAPKELWQSINSGWSFGNVTINEQNSSAPQTEQAILAQESYGRQIGKLLDAVSELIKEHPESADNKAYGEVAALKARIDRLKHETAVSRIDQLRRDLDLLRTSDRPEDRATYRENLEALRALVEEAQAEP